jgi:hypothetical protein
MCGLILHAGPHSYPLDQRIHTTPICSLWATLTTQRRKTVTQSIPPTCPSSYLDRWETTDPILVTRGQRKHTHNRDYIYS